MRIGKRRISKKLALIVVPVVLVLGVTTGALAATGTFTDIAGNAHEQSIIKMADRGITTGYPDGTFRPDQPVTRGQMMTFLDRADSCTQCHNDTTVLTGKEASWKLSLHGSGTAFAEEGGRNTCAGCHSGGAFSAMVAAGLAPNTVATGDANPTPQDCRACHQIHTSYTAADWALETTAPVALYTLTGNTFDGGEGNLCVNCHQSRSKIPAAVDGKVTFTTRVGPHYGPQSSTLLGIGGTTTGTPMAHYTMVENTCVTCHMGSGGSHTFEPNVATCVTCHTGATNFDIGGVQTEVQGMLDELKAALVAKGMLTEAGAAVAGSYAAAEAAALWNYFDVTNDASLGVHNPDYVKALLQAGLDAL